MSYEGKHHHGHENHAGHRHGRHDAPRAVGFIATHPHEHFSQWAARRAHDLDDLLPQRPDIAMAADTASYALPEDGRATDGSYHSEADQRPRETGTSHDTVVAPALVHPQDSVWEARFAAQRTNIPH